tara:strand:+ start:374 stop:775 length:402 start_codon:yes stop_codon:yes gene_type:complete
MSIAKTEAALEATRQKIVKQLSMVGRSIQSIDPTLYDKEQELEGLLKHLQEVRDAPTRSQKLLLVNDFEEQDTTDWKQELRDSINDKSKKYDMPRDKHGYANLMAQLAANNEIDKKRLDALIARAQEEQDDEG